MQGFVKKVYRKPLILSLLISVGTGALGALLTRNSMDVYSGLQKPALAPPAALFPIVWTVLFIMMGVAAYLAYVYGEERRLPALAVYTLQLMLNFCWTLVFFNAKNYLGAFVILIILWIAILVSTVLFFRIKPAAGWLMVPYLLWVTFAGYLNYAIYTLNS